MKRIRILPIVLIAVLIAASWSCSRFEAFKLGDLDTEMEFKPGIIAPLAYGSFNLQDVLEDIDTTGLLLISDDGHWCHRVTSPRSQCNKTYLLETAKPITAEAIETIEQGILLDNDLQEQTIITIFT